MKMVAENANDFAPIRTTDRGNCLYAFDSATRQLMDAAWELKG